MLAKPLLNMAMLFLLAAITSTSHAAEAYDIAYDKVWQNLKHKEWELATKNAEVAVKNASTDAELAYALELKATALAGSGGRWGGGQEAAEVFQRLLDKKLLQAVVADDPDSGKDFAAELKFKAQSYLSIYYGDDRYRSDLLKVIKAQLRSDDDWSPKWALNYAHLHWPGAKEKAAEKADALLKATERGVPVNKSLKTVLSSEVFKENPTMIQQAACNGGSGNVDDSPFLAPSMMPYGDPEFLSLIYRAEEASTDYKRYMRDYQHELRYRGKASLQASFLSKFQHCLDKYAVVEEARAQREKVKFKRLRAGSREASDALLPILAAKDREFDYASEQYDAAGCSDFSYRSLSLAETLYLCPVGAWATNSRLQFEIAGKSATDWEPPLLEPSRHPDVSKEPVVRKFCKLTMWSDDTALKRAESLHAVMNSVQTKRLLETQRYLTSCKFPQ